MQRIAALTEHPTSQTTPRRIPGHDVDTLKLCVAGAWAHGTISRGRAFELARSCGWDTADLEILKNAEEGRETSALTDACNAALRLDASEAPS